MAAVIALPAKSQDFDTVSLDAFIHETMAASNVPGLSIAVFDNTGIIYEKAYGIADTDQTPVTPQTPFQLGSVSKSFAALMILQLADEGKVDLDAPVTRYVPYFKTRDAARSEQITVRQILTHQSGLSTLTGNQLQDNDYRGADALRRAVETLARAKLTAEPGEQWAYSNANYILAAALIEAVTDRRYETAAKTRIFDPLGMTKSYIQMPYGDSLGESMGFVQWFGRPSGQRSVPGRAWMAAGGATASVQDLAIYLQAFATQDSRIIPQKYANALLSAQWQTDDRTYGYGFGWMYSEIEGRKIIWHSGLNGGFAAQAAWIPAESRGVAVLTNQSGSLQADVPGAVVRKALGLPIGQSKPSINQRLLVWGLLLTVITLGFSWWLSMKRFSAYARQAGRVNILRRAIPSFALLGLAYGVAFVAPPLNGVPLGGLRVFYPDVWLCLTLIALIATGWAITRLIYPRNTADNDLE